MIHDGITGLEVTTVYQVEGSIHRTTETTANEQAISPPPHPTISLPLKKKHTAQRLQAF